MMLGQPTTDAERADEQRQLARRSAAREARLARAIAEYVAVVESGVDARTASIRLAQVHKLGKGGAAWLRSQSN